MKSLSELTGERYRLEFDESWEYERPEVRLADRVWYEHILCKMNAFISLYCLGEHPCSLAAWCPLRRADCRDHGGPILQLWTPRPKNARRIWEVIKDEASCHLDPLEGEAVLYFPARLLPVVAELAGARKRRQLSPEQRSKLVEVGRATRFSAPVRGVERQKTAPEARLSGQGRVNVPLAFTPQFCQPVETVSAAFLEAEDLGKES
ncbi:MAG: hypothetical protein WHT07_10740 [Desulfobaccales bacterium]